MERCFLFLVLASLLSFCHAKHYIVGGRDEWVERPEVSYEDWAAETKLEVGDVLVFKYPKGEDSVVAVNKKGYEKCDKSHAIKYEDNGSSEFKLSLPGSVYFISGKKASCEKGQKLHVVVAPGADAPSPSPSVSPSSAPSPHLAHPRLSHSTPSPSSAPSPHLAHPILSHSTPPKDHRPAPKTPAPAPAPSTRAAAPKEDHPQAHNPSPAPADDEGHVHHHAPAPAPSSHKKSSANAITGSSFLAPVAAFLVAAIIMLV